MHIKPLLAAALLLLPAPIASLAQPASQPAAATAPGGAATSPTTAPADTPPRKNAKGEWVLTFENATVGKAIPTWTQGGITFALAGPPQNSRAPARIMFFPHLKTDRQGILNAMANEQAIPVRADIPGGASSVTLVLWGTIGCHALVEAHDKDGKLLDSASLPGTVPERKSPSDPIPSFELTVKGDHIAYILFGGAINGGSLVADEMRYMPMK